MTAVGWRVSGFTELRELGAGAEGRVVLARHDESGQSVAIKYVHGNTMRLRSEADMLKRLDNQYVIRLYDFVAAPDGAALLLEYVDGCTLGEVLAVRGAMPPEAALAVLKGSLLGLAAGHALGIVHRDYRPDNVLVGGVDGRSKLAAFGIGGEGGAGTPSYMAPELWSGGPVTPATDVYAATCVFFECVTGRKPYLPQATGEFAVADLDRQHTESPIPLDGLPEQLRQLVAWGMGKKAGQRPRGAAAFVEEVERTAAEVYGADWELRGLAILALGVATRPEPPTAPAAGRSVPVSGQSGPAAGQGGPVTGQSGPAAAAGQGGPMAGQGGPAAGQGGPMAGRGGPVAGQSGPVIGRHSAAAVRRSDRMAEQSRAMTGMVIRAKTGILAFAASRAAMIAAGALVVALGAGTAYVATRPDGKPKTGSASAFGFAAAGLNVSYPVPGRPAFKVTGSGIPQVTGGNKKQREAINEALREPVDKAVAESRKALEDSVQLGKASGGCAGATLSVSAATGQLGPQLISVRYRFAAGLLCTAESLGSYASVTVDLGKAEAVSPEAMFRSGKLPVLAGRLRWQGSAAGCPAPKTLSSDAQNPVVFTFLKSGLEAAQPADGLGCADQRALIVYSKIADLLQPGVYAKALAGAVIAPPATSTVAPSETPVSLGPGGACSPTDPPLRIGIVLGQITCADATKIARQDKAAPGSHGKWTCVQQRRFDADVAGGRSCTNKIVTFVYS